MISKNKKGFTLVELLIVISVLGLISSIALVILNKARQKSQAARIAADFNSIYKAWQIWRIDSGMDFVHENIYGNVNKDAPCHDEPILSDTDLFQNISGISNWSGPYMTEIPKGPWGREYSYDNDGDTWTPQGNKWRGVNIQLQWCQGEGVVYLQLAPYIDAIIDKGDGKNKGLFKWDNSAPGGYGILIAPSFDN